MDGLVQTNLGQQAFYTKTFHSLVLHIIQTSSNKNVTISELEVNEQKRYKLLINEWQKQCHEKIAGKRVA